MTTLARKYAKDLNTGDKVNAHEAGWLTVTKKSRNPFTQKTEVIFHNGETHIYDSHTLFEDVVVGY